MKKKIWGILVGVFSLLLAWGMVFAEVDWSPGKFDNDGTLGKQRRFRQIYVRDLNVSGMIQPGVVIVNEWTDFTQTGVGASGASIYQIDLTLGNEFWVDVDAIATDVAVDVATTQTVSLAAGRSGATVFQQTMLQASGVTVLAPSVDVTNDKAIFKLKRIGTSGTTPVRLWAAYDEWIAGTTLFQKVEAVYPVTQAGISGGSPYNTDSSVSDYGIYEPSDSRTYMLSNGDINSGDSIFVVDMTHRKPYLH